MIFPPPSTGRGNLKITSLLSSVGTVVLPITIASFSLFDSADAVTAIPVIEFPN